jgi:glycosyltransferase involved in cell wall biosynthesis
MESLRISIITPSFPPYFSGMSNVAFHNALELAKLGNEVTVYTPNFSREMVYPKILNIKKLRCIIRYGNSSLPLKLFSIPYDSYDVVHLHYPFYFGGDIVYISSKLKKFDYILTYHMDVILQGILKRLFIKIHDVVLMKRTVQTAKRIIVSSYDYAKHSKIKDIIDRERNKVIEIPPGVDLERFTPNVSGASIREKFRIDESEKVILFVGALDKSHYFKGLDYLFKSLVKLKALEWILLVVGDGELKPYYIKLARRFSIYNRVIFASSVPYEELPRYYAASDIFVLPSINMGEAFGLVLLEAMASGKPVIASRLPGVRTVVKENKTGLLVEPQNIEELTLKLKFLLTNYEIGLKFGRNGRKEAENYSWPNVARKILNTYKNS